jgi:hypothetical protein
MLRSRLALAVALVLAAAAFALVAARPADAYVDYFCPSGGGSQYYPSGADCGVGALHHLDTVAFVETSTGTFRHCANFIVDGGGLAAWKCDYTTTVIKYPGGQAGRGYVHNGDPSSFYGWANETF